MNEIIKKIIKERQTVKMYSNKKIPDEDWEQIKDMIQWAPSSHGYEPYRILVVKRNSPLREELVKPMNAQGQVLSSDKLIFFISLDSKTYLNEQWGVANSLRKAKEVLGLKGEEALSKAKILGKEILNGHLLIDEATPEGDAWSMKQTYIGLMAGLIGATLLGIGSTPMEGINRKEIENLFLSKGLLKNNERISVAAAFGYPISNTAYAHFGSGKRVRFSKEEKFKEV